MLALGHQHAAGEGARAAPAVQLRLKLRELLHHLQRRARRHGIGDDADLFRRVRAPGENARACDDGDEESEDG
ncbi:hypothetical protein GCM10009422_20010 [Brevundimonas kwangchunensis]|uniref:Uncharacterized protein n=1 Tax=Brevundimonas kwangchunensis TaxID=322163 RepID=A0ABP3S1T3_9CAUL